MSIRTDASQCVSKLMGPCGCNALQGIMGVFMREPLLDWQREARVLSTKGSAASSAKDPFSAADTVDPQDMHINLKVRAGARGGKSVHRGRGWGCWFNLILTQYVLSVPLAA